MTPSFNDRLAKWQQLPSWAVCLGCVSGTERTYPVVRELASGESAAICRKALDAAWLTSLKPARGGLLEHSLAAIQELPESSIDDSHSRTFLAMRAISVLAYALEALIGGRPPTQTLRYSVSALLQLSADLGGPDLENLETKDMEWVRQRLETAPGLTEELVSEIRDQSVEMALSYAQAAKKLGTR